MENVSVYLHDIPYFFKDGFREGFAHVNGALGLLIAVFAAYQLSEWRRIWAVAFGATLAHLIAVIILPVLVNEGSFRLPPDLLEITYWKTAAALFLGYLVAIAVFFAIKTQLLSKGSAEAAHH
jgi:cellobiose-specific phosphotransferase system component IIC